MDHILFKVEILSNEDREWHESFSLVLGPDDPVEAILGEITMATVTILDQEASGSLILPAPPIVRKLHPSILFMIIYYIFILRSDKQKLDAERMMPSVSLSFF